MEWKETTKTNTRSFGVLFSCSICFQTQGGVSLEKKLCGRAISWLWQLIRTVKPALPPSPGLPIFSISQRHQELKPGACDEVLPPSKWFFAATVPHARPLIPLSRFHMGRDGNGYPIPGYPTGFTRYKDGYGMNSSPVSMLMGTILYPSGRRVRVRVWTTHTRVPMGNLYPQQSCIEHNKLDPYRYIYSKNWSICLLLCY